MCVKGGAAGEENRGAGDTSAVCREKKGEEQKKGGEKAVYLEIVDKDEM